MLNEKVLGFLKDVTQVMLELIKENRKDVPKPQTSHSDATFPVPRRRFSELILDLYAIITQADKKQSKNRFVQETEWRTYSA